VIDDVAYLTTAKTLGGRGLLATGVNENSEAEAAMTTKTTTRRRDRDERRR
jgi:hypothetical protein